ncbi:MAG TPA: tRNA (adenosine(37)-N6)-threonylcarbamoyltransferase complex ATPase subunit type 1 TsaE [Acidimicrobiales bacterium]|nr:tRNA (adenosine(37)-N6)-threonylcarbamoyltransferase complex ATPase subunit type 1 TsaE [Acidimicrobiales bacterium]
MSPAAGEPAPVRLRTKSAHDTRAMGAALARGLRPGDVVLLAGDLGSGKTTLAQGIAAGLGVADHVTSPTFTLVRSYPVPPRAGEGDGVEGDGVEGIPPVRTFLHADLYRLEHLGEVADLAIGELVEDDAVAVVEWGDVAEPVLGRDALTVRLSPDEHEDQRRVTIDLARSWGTRRDELAHLLCQWATS